MSDTSLTESEDGGANREAETLDMPPCLFQSHAGHAMSFFVNIDCPPKLRQSLQRAIISCGGRIETNIEDIHVRTAVLVFPGSVSKLIEFKGFTFEARYIEDCVERKTLLDIKSYVLSQPAGIFPSSVNFWDVFYWRTAVLPQVTDSESTVSGDDVESDSTSDELWNSRKNESRISSNSYRTINKKSRAPYSRGEKEAILKFIVAKKAYHRTKGNQLYVDMENHNICPARTNQSMRNHFLKTIVNELNTFPFLSDGQRKRLRDNI